MNGIIINIEINDLIYDKLINNIYLFETLTVNKYYFIDIGPLANSV